MTSAINTSGANAFVSSTAHDGLRGSDFEANTIANPSKIDTSATAALSALLASVGRLRTLESTDQRSADGLKNGANAAALTPPEKTFSTDDISVLVAGLQMKVGDEQLKSQSVGIKSNEVKVRKNNENQLQKLTDRIKKSEDADGKGLFGKIFSWIGKVAAVVFSAIAVAALAAGSVVTGGAATPLLVMATMALIGSTISLADQISQECGGPEISLGKMLTSVVGAALKAFGVDEEQADKIAKIVAGVAAIVTVAPLIMEPAILGNMVSTVAEMSGADPETAAIIGMAFTMAASVTVGLVSAVASFGSSALSTAARVANAAGQIVQGGTQTLQGGLGVAVAVDRADVEKLDADRKEIDVDTKKLEKLMQIQRDDVATLIEQIQGAINIAVQMAKGYAETSDDIVNSHNRVRA